MHRVLTAALVMSWSMPGAAAQDFQFMPFAPRAKTSLLPISGGYTGYAVADDMNGDGRSDLVVSFNDYAAAVFAGAPTGWVVPSYWFSWQLQKPVLVDLDGDGDRDLVGVPPYLPFERPVLVYANTPNGMSVVTMPWQTGTPVQAVAVGNLDADGFADLVIATPPGSVTPSLVLARGGAGLQFTLDLTSMPVLPYGLWPELLDVDGDGDLDVLATNATSGMRLLRNVGGTFVDATSSLPAMRSGHTWLKATDLDGDGRTDCAATLANGDVDVLWGAPGGPTFAAAVATVPGVRGLYPGDFDGDGDLDLLAEHSGGLDVLWNQGPRQFARAAAVAQPTGLRGVADVDLDGAQDVLFSATGDLGYLRCLYRAAVEDAAFALGLAPVPTGFPRGISAAGDVDGDGDGRTDLVMPGQTLITVDRALGGGAYRRSTSPLSNPVTGGSWSTELADMDGDADLDLVVKDDARVSVVDNDGTGTFAARSLLAVSNGTAVDDLRVADVDADGDRDLVLADTRGVVLIRNQGGGLYAPPAVLVPTVPAAQRSLEVADVDGDGDLDVISGILATSGATHVILANDGHGFFAPNAAFVAHLGFTPSSVRSGDIDADGDVDLVVADNTALRVLRNDGSGSFADTTQSDVPASSTAILSNLVAADLDDDGDVDLAAVQTGSAVVRLLLNDGSGRFTDVSTVRVAQFVSSGAGVWLLRATDFDDDGDADLIAQTGLQHFVLANHLRQCRSNAVPRLGGVADLHLMSGPNFGAPGLAMLGVGFGLAAPPLQLPGLAGQLQLDPATLQVLAAVPTSSIGVSSAFVAVPPDPLLFGLKLWFQGAILPAVGTPGLTNAVYDIVLR